MAICFVLSAVTPLSKHLEEDAGLLVLLYGSCFSFAVQVNFCDLMMCRIIGH